MSRPISLDGFERMFGGNADTWRTFSSRDEANKRAAILRALGPGPLGRVLELASGNGSNSVALAERALRLDATEGTHTGTRLTANVLGQHPRARASRLILPGRFPRSQYDAAVVAELLYYLSPNQMRQVARDVADALRPGAVLVLAHHGIDFHDFAQHARGIQRRFLDASGRRWRRVGGRRTIWWQVAGFRAV